MSRTQAPPLTRVRVLFLPLTDIFDVAWLDKVDLSFLAVVVLAQEMNYVELPR